MLWGKWPHCTVRIHWVPVNIQASKLPKKLTTVWLVQFAEQVDKLWSYCGKRNHYKTGYTVIGPIDQRGHLSTGT